MKFGLSKKTIQSMQEILARHLTVDKAIIYGSRAKGNHKKGSDIDLTLCGDRLNAKTCMIISGELDELPIPYMIDLSIHSEIENIKLQDHIKRIGKVFYERKIEKWKMVQLREVVEVIAGLSPEKAYCNKEGKGLPFYQGQKDYGARFLNPPKVWTTQITEQAQPDDILMSVQAPVGALNIALENICIGRDLVALRTTSASIIRDYLYYYLLLIVENLSESKGAISGSINKKQIEDIAVPLPSLTEQKRIVAKLNTVFAQIDIAESSIQKQLAEHKALKSAMLAGEFINKVT